ncbi:MAG: hypothetical protein H6Q58_2293 [Firmicutes bacterium]|nr:hypothetical protein [Bacillota bacterium]
MDKKYVWYACYGSNLLKERFLLYIHGGDCRFNGKRYNGCSDKSLPLDDRPYNITHKMYFAKESRSWENQGVAFIEAKNSEETITLGRVYLITEGQFNDIHFQEGKVWYDKILDVGTFDGIPVKTFTHSTKFAENLPGTKYLDVVTKGLKETYPDITEKVIDEYLRQCQMSHPDMI